MGIAVITGASSGMGKEFVLQLDQMFDFDEIWLIARRTEVLNELSKKLKNKSKVLTLDLNNQDNLDKYVNELKACNKKVDFLINSAGFGQFGNYEEVSLDVSLRMIDLNCKAMVFMTMQTLEYMDQGSRIINLGSASSFFPLINLNVYASTKAFVVHYSNALNDELKSRGISVTVVCPGWVNTEFFSVAKNLENVHGPKRYVPMLEANEVVKRAIKASLKGKKFSVYNGYTKLHKFGARFFPRWFMLWQWKNMQKKINKEEEK